MSNCQLLNPCSHYRISPRGHTDDTQTWSCVSSSMSSPPIGLDLWSSEQSTRGQLVLARDPEVVLPLPMGPAALSIPSIGGMETLRGLSTLCWSVLSRRRRIPRSWLPRSRSSDITPTAGESYLRIGAAQIISSRGARIHHCRKAQRPDWSGEVLQRYHLKCGRQEQLLPEHSRLLRAHCW